MESNNGVSSGTAGLNDMSDENSNDLYQLKILHSTTSHTSFSRQKTNHYLTENKLNAVEKKVNDTNLKVPTPNNLLLGPPTRNPRCAHCRNHGVQTALKGHKPFCEYRLCKCPECQLVRMRQKVMAKNVALRRRQELDRQRIQEGLEEKRQGGESNEEINGFKEKTRSGFDARIPKIVANRDTKDPISTLALIILNFYNNDPKIAIDSVKKVASELDTLMQKEPLTETDLAPCLQKEQVMKTRCDKIGSNGIDKSFKLTFPRSNESLTTISSSSPYSPSTSFKGPMTTNVKNNNATKCFLPIVSTWPFKKIHSFHENEKSTSYTEIQNQHGYQKIKVEEMKVEEELKECSENDIENSPYSIKNLTSNLPKRPKMASVVYTPAPTYNDYAYVNNSSLFRKFLSSHTPYSHKFYDSRLYNYPGLYFPSLPSYHFHNHPSTSKPTLNSANNK